jgi:hypothetical protein
MLKIEPGESYTPEKTLAKQGVTAIFSLAAGVFIFVMNILGARFPVVGLALGALSAIVGVVAMRSRDPEDKKPGLFLVLAGVLELLSRFGVQAFRPVAGTLLSIGAFAFAAFGIWNGVKFLRELNRRS